MTRALLEQALEALETCSTLTARQWFSEDRVDAAREAIRAHLALPQGEPAWHDAPTVPGDWAELHTGITQQEIDRASGWPGRWYGPIPDDGGKP